MAHPFDEAIDLEPIDGGVRVQTHPAFGNMVGPFGGITSAAVTQALAAHADALGEPVAITVNFAGPIADGTWDLHLDPARTNRSNQHWTFTGMQNDDTVLTGTAILAHRRETWSDTEAIPPNAPAPHDLETTDLTSLVAWPGNYEMRFVDGRTVGSPEVALDEAITTLWIRQEPERRWDHAAIASVADAFTPRVFQRLGPTPAGTITFTVYFHAGAEELAQVGDWLLATARPSRFHGGVFDQRGELWGDGRLLATTHQLVYFKAPPAAAG